MSFKTVICSRLREDEIRDMVCIGQQVVFSTSGKYNPGFHATEAYRGKVVGLTDGGLFVRENRKGRIACIKYKHLEEIDVKI